VVHKTKTLIVIGLLMTLLWLAACGPTAPTSTPTPDLNPFRTEVAATVLAQVTQALALTPSATPTLAPTATQEPTEAPDPTASLTVDPTSGTPSSGTENRAAWVSQSVADDTTFAPGETFTMSWRLRNAGTSAWTGAYVFRFYSGNDFGAPEEIMIEQGVAPGAEIEISVEMQAPASPGSYRSDWVMANESRSNFNEPVYLKINVAVPVTPTPTADE